MWLFAGLLIVAVTATLLSQTGSDWRNVQQRMCTHFVNERCNHLVNEWLMSGTSSRLGSKAKADSKSVCGYGVAVQVFPCGINLSNFDT
jgi:hypothetical protein